MAIISGNEKELEVIRKSMERMSKTMRTMGITMDRMTKTFAQMGGMISIRDAYIHAVTEIMEL
jgi:hypothetical protein